MVRMHQSYTFRFLTIPISPALPKRPLVPGPGMRLILAAKPVAVL